MTTSSPPHPSLALLSLFALTLPLGCMGELELTPETDQALLARLGEPCRLVPAPTGGESVVDDAHPPGLCVGAGPEAPLPVEPPVISCRCAGPDAGPFCTCPSGFSCHEFITPLGWPASDPYAGSYCFADP